MAIGMICCGWIAQAHIHWIVPIISTTLVGIADVYHLIAVDSYLVDAFTTYFASAIAVNIVIRSLLAALMPLAAPTRYEILATAGEILAWDLLSLRWLLLRISCNYTERPFGQIRSFRWRFNWNSWVDDCKFVQDVGS